MTHRASVAIVTTIALLAAAPATLAAEVRADMALATLSGPGAAVGAVAITDTPGGARIHVHLTGLPPGQHGFHAHANPSCDPGPVNGVVAPAGAAGGHFDPDHTGAHMGPNGMGHMGDLPYLTVAADGTDDEVVMAPRITDVTVLKGHSLMIHAGGDNYSDQPKPLGGGGPRIACGVVN
jgi:superoxide dismutase, Cu-Zn family